MSCRFAIISNKEDDNDYDGDADYGDDIIKEENGENSDDLQATLAAYARRKFSSGEISTEHMRNIMKVGFPGFPGSCFPDYNSDYNFEHMRNIAKVGLQFC